MHRPERQRRMRRVHIAVVKVPECAVVHFLAPARSESSADGLRAAVEDAPAELVCVLGSSNSTEVMTALQQALPVQFSCLWHHRISRRQLVTVLALYVSLITGVAACYWSTLVQACAALRPAISAPLCMPALGSITGMTVCWGLWVAVDMLCGTFLVHRLAFAVESGLSYCVNTSSVYSARLHAPRVLRTYSPCVQSRATLLTLTHRATSLRVRIVSVELPSNPELQVPVACDALDLMRPASAELAQATCGVMLGIVPPGFVGTAAEEAMHCFFRRTGLASLTLDEAVVVAVRGHRPDWTWDVQLHNQTESCATVVALVERSRDERDMPVVHIPPARAAF